MSIVVKNFIVHPFKTLIMQTLDITEVLPAADAVEKKIIEFCAEESSMEKEEINLSSRLNEDLDLGGIEIVMLISDIEEEFKIKIPDEKVELCDTVENLIEIARQSGAIDTKKVRFTIISMLVKAPNWKMTYQKLKDELEKIAPLLRIPNLKSILAEVHWLKNKKFLRLTDGHNASQRTIKLAPKGKGALLLFAEDFANSLA